MPRRLDSALPQSFLPRWVLVRQSGWDAPCRTPQLHWSARSAGTCLIPPRTSPCSGGFTGHGLSPSRVISERLCRTVLLSPTRLPAGCWGGPCSASSRCSPFTTSCDQQRRGACAGAICIASQKTNNVAILACTGSSASGSTRRMPGHAAHQHVLVESEGLGRLMRAMIWHFAPADRSQQLWTLRESQHLAQFYLVLQRLGIRSLQLTLHGLRGGGATEHWLSQRDIPGLRRRGRWTSERTLERYVHEGAFCLHTLSLDNDSASKIRELATLAPSFFVSVLPDPPPSPATTEKIERDR